MKPPSPTPEALRWVWKGLRNRYRPDHRISRGMVTAAPWVDIALLIIFFLLCSLPFVLQPGIAIELPASHIGEGHPFGHTMVVVIQDDPRNDQPHVVVFFDDRRFHAETERDALRDALLHAVIQRPDLPLIIEADHRIRHGFLVDLYGLAAEAGLPEIHVATRPF